TNTASKPFEQSESRSPPANKPDEKPQNPPEDDAAPKPEDPCDATKQLIDVELRHWLCKSGLKIGITETSELLGSRPGGIRQGARYEGVTDLNLSIDLRPLVHVRGNIFARAYQIHGRGL